MTRFHAALRRGVPRLATVLGVLAICLGASSKSCRLIQDNIENRDGQFVTSLTLQNPSAQITDVFERDEQIEFVMTVRNELDRTAIIEFPTTRTFDFVVLREGTDEIVWQWSEDQPIQQTPSEIEFAPEETQTFRATWDQISNLDVQVRPGTYEARGVLVFRGFDSNPREQNQQGSTIQRFTILDD